MARAQGEQGARRAGGSSVVGGFCGPSDLGDGDAHGDDARTARADGAGRDSARGGDGGNGGGYDGYGALRQLEARRGTGGSSALEDGPIAALRARTPSLRLPSAHGAGRRDGHVFASLPTSPRRRASSLRPSPSGSPFGLRLEQQHLTPHGMPLAGDGAGPEPFARSRRSASVDLAATADWRAAAPSSTPRRLQRLSSEPANLGADGHGETGAAHGAHACDVARAWDEAALAAVDMADRSPRPDEVAAELARAKVAFADLSGEVVELRARLARATVTAGGTPPAAATASVESGRKPKRSSTFSFARSRAARGGSAPAGGAVQGAVRDL